MRLELWSRHDAGREGRRRVAAVLLFLALGLGPLLLGLRASELDCWRTDRGVTCEQRDVFGAGLFRTRRRLEAVEALRFEGDTRRGLSPGREDLPVEREQHVVEPPLVEVGLRRLER